MCLCDQSFAVQSLEGENLGELSSFCLSSEKLNGPSSRYKVYVVVMNYVNGDG